MSDQMKPLLGAVNWDAEQDEDDFANCPECNAAPTEEHDEDCPYYDDLED